MCVSCHRTVNSCFYQIYELFLVNYKSDFQFLQMRYLNNNFFIVEKRKLTGCTGSCCHPREYSVIYRGPGILAAVGFGFFFFGLVFQWLKILKYSKRLLWVCGMKNWKNCTPITMKGALGTDTSFYKFRKNYCKIHKRMTAS